MATGKYYVLCGKNCKYEGMTKEQILTAITQAVNEGTVGDVDTGFISTVKTINGKTLKFFVGEQSEYEALTESQRDGLFAIITNDTSKESILNAIVQLNAVVNSQGGVILMLDTEITTAKNDISELQGLCNSQMLKRLSTPTMNEAETKCVFPVGTLLTLRTEDEHQMYAELTGLRMQNENLQCVTDSYSTSGTYKAIMGTWRVCGLCGTDTVISDVGNGNVITQQDRFYLIQCISEG